MIHNNVKNVNIYKCRFKNLAIFMNCLYFIASWNSLLKKTHVDLMTLINYNCKRLANYILIR